ncbi:hypothetical protein Tco_0888411, partial [Tanacetum coccineum]
CYNSHVFVKSHATVTYTSISSAERSWSIPAMDPYEEVICTDIAKITRKRSKPDKHGHENG